MLENVNYPRFDEIFFINIYLLVKKNAKNEDSSKMSMTSFSTSCSLIDVSPFLYCKCHELC